LSEAGDWCFEFEELERVSGPYNAVDAESYQDCCEDAGGDAGGRAIERSVSVAVLCRMSLEGGGVESVLSQQWVSAFAHLSLRDL
jgi:hypothetical protein